jgi:hypothetical protein
LQGRKIYIKYLGGLYAYVCAACTVVLLLYINPVRLSYIANAIVFLLEYERFRIIAVFLLLVYKIVFELAVNIYFYAHIIGT